MCYLFYGQICYQTCVLSLNVYLPSMGAGNLSQALIASCSWRQAKSSRRWEPPSWSHLHSSLLALAMIAWKWLLSGGGGWGHFELQGAVLPSRASQNVLSFIWNDEKLNVSVSYYSSLPISPTNGQWTKELLVYWNSCCCLNKSQVRSLTCVSLVRTWSPFQVCTECVTCCRACGQHFCTSARGWDGSKEMLMKGSACHTWIQLAQASWHPTCMHPQIHHKDKSHET